MKHQVLRAVLPVVASVLVAPALAQSAVAQSAVAQSAVARSAVARSAVAQSATAQAQPEVSRRPDGSISYRDPAVSGTPTASVRGELRSIADGRGGADERIIVRSDGSIVPVSIDLPSAVSASPRRVAADLVADPYATAQQPAQVAAASIAAPPAERSIPNPLDLRARVVVVTNSGSVGTDAQIGRRVDAGLAYWRAEGGSSVRSASRIGSIVRYRSRLKDPCGFSTVGPAFAEAQRQVPTPTAGEHLVIVVARTCDGTGIGDVGADLSSSGTLLMTDDAAVFTATLAHELGHNVGLEHANLVCTTCAKSLEYFDLYSPMGLAVVGAIPPFEPPALDTPFRHQLGIDAAGEVATWTPARGESRSLTLAPRGGDTGSRGIEVREGGRSTWIELREGSGRDAGSYYARADGAVVDDHAYPSGVTIATRGTDSTGPLDLQEASPGVGSWSTGQVYGSRSSRDRDLSVRIDSVGGGRATVTVVRGPVVAGRVDVTGTPRVGAVLRAARRGWSADTRLAHVWRVDGAAVPGATGSTFSPRAVDVGRRVSVEVRGSRPGATRSAPVTSAPTTPVGLGRLDGSVRLGAGPRVGSTTRAVPTGYPAGTRWTYQWSIDQTIVQGATSATFRPAANQRRRVLTVRVEAQAPGYETSSTDSPPAAIGWGRLRASTPRVSGTRRVGRTVRAVPGRWSPTPSFRYRWYADGRPIAGATRGTLRLSSGLRGKRISIRVTGREPGYVTASRRSAATAAVRR